MKITSNSKEKGKWYEKPINTWKLEAKSYEVPTIIILSTTSIILIILTILK